MDSNSRHQVGPALQPGTFSVEPDLAERWEELDDTTYIFQGDVDHQVVGEFFESCLEFGEHYMRGNTQVDGCLKEQIASHRSIRALGMEFINIDATLGQGVRDVSDNPPMITPDQVEHKPAVILPRGVAGAARDHYLESL